MQHRNSNNPKKKFSVYQQTRWINLEQHYYEQLTFFHHSQIFPRDPLYFFVIHHNFALLNLLCNRIVCTYPPSKQVHRKTYALFLILAVFPCIFFFPHVCYIFLFIWLCSTEACITQLSL